MIIEQKETTIAYRCPHCGTGVLSLVGVFKLSADRLKLKCQCGHSEMTITRSKDSKVRIEMPCVICQAPHHFTVNESLFFGERLFIFPCHASGFDVCFLGAQESVTKTLEESGNKLFEMIEGAGMSCEDFFEKEKSEEKIPDAHIYDIVNFLVRELEYDGKVHCECEQGPYNAYFSEDGESIIVKCESCNCTKEFKADSVVAAQDFLGLDEIILT